MAKSGQPKLYDKYKREQPDKLFQVIGFFENEMRLKQSVTQLCEKLGITRAQYYAIIREHKKSIAHKS